MKKTLKLECRGCNVINGINSRVTFFKEDEFLKGADGRNYHLEFSIGRRIIDKKDYKFLHLATYYYDENGQCYGNNEFENKVWNMQLEYTKQSILRVANMLLKDNYTDIEFLD